MVSSFDRDIGNDSFYINKDNEMMFDERFYTCRAFSEGYGLVAEGVDGMHLKYGIIDHDGNIVVPIEHRLMKGVRDGLYGVGVFPEDMPPDGAYEDWMGWSFVDIATGEVKFEWPNSGVKEFHNGYLVVHFEGEGYGIVNTEGETVVAPQFRFIFRIPGEGLYEFRRKGKGEKSGYMTATGEVVIPAQFDSASPFYGKLARIRKDGQWGYVDLDGEVIYDKDVFSSE